MGYSASGSTGVILIASARAEGLLSELNGLARRSQASAHSITRCTHSPGYHAKSFIFFRPLCSRSAQNIGVSSIQYSHGGAPIKLSASGAQLNLYILVSVLTLQSPVEASSQGDRREVCSRCCPQNGEHLSRSRNQQKPNQ